MKKFITATPLQAASDELGTLTYYAVGNSKLQLDKPISFPILAAVNGYVKPGEDFRLITVMTETPANVHNRDRLIQQLKSLCQDRGLKCPEVETVVIGEGQKVSTHVETFRKLLDYVDDSDELFCCMTFGTKPLSQAMMLAVQYAYRIKRNASISCIVYGEIDHSKPKPWKDGCIYDMTALIQMDEIVHMLAERGVSDPKAALDAMLSL